MLSISIKFMGNLKFLTGNAGDVINNRQLDGAFVPGNIRGPIFNKYVSGLSNKIFC